MSWKKENVVSLLKSLLDEETHNNFVLNKKINKIDLWYQQVGDKYHVSGTKVRDLLRNLGYEYRSFQQRASVSGEATEEKTLKGTSEIFGLYENFIGVYYPKGCAVKPNIIMSESGEEGQTLVSQDSEDEMEVVAASSKNREHLFILFILFIEPLSRANRGKNTKGKDTSPKRISTENERKKSDEVGM